MGENLVNSVCEKKDMQEFLDFQKQKLWQRQLADIDL